MYGVVILTMNEERALPAALASIPDGCPVTVVDSGSTDRTVEIAESVGASVIRNPFTGFGDQRNHAIEHAPDGEAWQLHLDADERMTPALDRAIQQALGREDLPDAFGLPNKTMLNGSWLRYSSGYPVYQTRLVDRRSARFMNVGHGQQETAETRTELIDEPYIHEAFIHGLDAWIEKHNRYSRQEADLDQEGRPQGSLGALLATDRVARRRALRELARRIPFAPTARLVHTLIIKRGLLDGAAGLQFARMLALYEQMKQLKRSELRAVARRRGTSLGGS